VVDVYVNHPLPAAPQAPLEDPRLEERGIGFAPWQPVRPPRSSHA